MGSAPTKPAGTTPGGKGPGKSGGQGESDGYHYENAYREDNRCPLSKKELYSLNKSWKAINREIAETAVNMFIRLFEENKDLQGYFSMFRDIQTEEDMRASKAFQTHALSVMCAIDDIIANLDDMDYVIAMVGALVESHIFKINDFEFQSVWKVKEPFLIAMRETLGPRFTPPVESIYTKTLDFLLGAIASGGSKGQEPEDTNGDLQVKDLTEETA